MQIQTIGTSGLVLYIEREELLHRGWDFPPSLREVLLLAREACRETGRPLERLAEIEAFPERQGLLAFLRLEPPEEEWFAFRDLAAALEGLCTLPEPPSGALAWDGARYCLRAEGGAQALRLAEFGDALHPAECAALEEQGTLVLEGERLAALWRRLKRK